MTVAELITELQKVDPNRIVILQKDAEGNGHKLLEGVDDNAVYEAINSWRGEVKYQTLTDEMRKQGYSDDDVGEGKPCLVLYPVN